MTRKIKGSATVQHFPTEPSFKWVKKANMYCKTWFENNKQHQEWLTKEEFDGLSNN